MARQIAALILNAGKPDWMPEDYWENGVKRLATYVLDGDEQQEAEALRLAQRVIDREISRIERSKGSAQ